MGKMDPPDRTVRRTKTSNRHNRQPKGISRSFHLEGKANQRWQWLHRAYQEEGHLVTWELFEEEPWAHFGPVEFEDFDESLSRVLQGPQLLLLECQSINQIKEYEVEDEGLQMEDTLGDQAKPKISLQALTGWTSPQTMRVAATGSQQVMVLIGSGSTHNLLSEKVAKLVRLPMVPTKSFVVRVANGERLICEGRFEKVQVNLQGITFSLTLYSLPLTRLDMVLDIQWLEMLGSMVCNWKQLTMNFH
ncbi:hypothetical protein Pint_21057 [Pistacia integerrima]|uniref:Uncharacterized protein n=1 Tax=Pistacia integerrima TaxID=434235 RepID=A0ACC0XBY4_9ROSI|nr:hypothetical protein Pint_21057 [Pistacia integerrima]